MPHRTHRAPRTRTSTPALARTRRSALAALAAVGLGLACAGESKEAGGCQSDADCKGDRICELGRCVDSGDPTTEGSSSGSGGVSESGGTDTAVHFCGDGEIDASEACDDGNKASYDGCDADCQPTRGGVIAAGSTHTCALIREGAIRCWGWGAGGMLGYGDQLDIGDDEPPSAAGPVEFDGEAIQITAGFARTCAVLQGGDLYCWGYGLYGALGHGDEENIGDDEPPTAAGPVSLGGPALQVDAGHDHVCALLEGGKVRCWGQNLYGELGYGHTNMIGDDELPSSVSPVNLGSPALQIAVGTSHTCALLEGGLIRCWGQNANGSLGRGVAGQVGDDEPPSAVSPVDLGRGALQVTAGNLRSCALVEGGDVYCWGWAELGALGYGNDEDIGDDEPPQAAGPVSLGGPAVQIASGDAHSCALLESGDVRCWGDNIAGQLGYGHTNRIGDDESPTSVEPVELGGRAIQIDAGSLHTCALLEDGSLRCWGDGIYGQLGYGNTDRVGNQPGEMPPPPIDFQ